MSDEMMAEIEARMALQDARIRALHDGFRVMAAEVDRLRGIVERYDRELTDLDGVIEEMDARIGTALAGATGA